MLRPCCGRFLIAEATRLVLQANDPSPVTITVQSESCLLLGASRRALVQLMGNGPAVMGLSADDAALASSALMATAALQDLNDTEIKSLVASFELREYSEGMVLAWAGEAADSMYIIKSGECLLTSAISPAQRQALQEASPQIAAKLPRVQSLAGDRLEAGAHVGEQALLGAPPRTTTLAALRDGTQVSFFIMYAFHAVLLLLGCHRRLRSKALMVQSINIQAGNCWQLRNQLQLECAFCKEQLFPSRGLLTMHIHHDIRGKYNHVCPFLHHVFSKTREPAHTYVPTANIPVSMSVNMLSVNPSAQAVSACQAWIARIVSMWTCNVTADPGPNKAEATCVNSMPHTHDHHVVRHD